MHIHDVQFPIHISNGSSGGPEWRTRIVSSVSGHEYRNGSWSRSRRRYNAGYGVKSSADLFSVVQFFEARCGALFGFRWRDVLDHSSGRPGQATTSTDVQIGIGDGQRTIFQLVRPYAESVPPQVNTVKDAAPAERKITRPVVGSVRIAIDGTESQSSDFTVDHTTGLVTFTTPPPATALVSAGFEFDTPVRFETDHLEVSMADIRYGSIPAIPLIEVIE